MARYGREYGQRAKSADSRRWHEPHSSDRAVEGGGDSSRAREEKGRGIAGGFRGQPGGAEERGAESALPLVRGVPAAIPVRAVAQPPEATSGAMQEEIERARRELEKIKSALDAAAAKKRSDEPEGGDSEFQNEAEVEEDGEMVAIGGAALGGGVVSNLRGEGVEEVKTEKVIAGEAVGPGAEGIAAGAGLVEGGRAKEVLPLVEKTGLEGVPEADMPAAEGGLVQRPVVLQSAELGNVVAAKEEESRDAVSRFGGVEAPIESDSPGGDLRLESEEERAARQKKVSFSEVETRYEPDESSTGLGAGSESLGPRPLGEAGLGERLAPIPEGTGGRAYSLSTGFGDPQAPPRRRGLSVSSVESDAEMAKREIPTVLAEDWETAEETRGAGGTDVPEKRTPTNSGAAVGAVVATGLAAGALGALAGRSVVGSSGEAGAGSVLSKPAGESGAPPPELPVKEPAHDGGPEARGIPAASQSAHGALLPKSSKFGANEFA